MSPTTSEIETADRLSRRRAKMFPILAVIFIAQQASFFSQPDGARLVDNVKIGAWVVLSIVLLLALATGGFWLKPRRIRQLMEDDLTRSNRASALSFGFLVTMAGGLLLYVLVSFEPLTARESIHLLTTLGIAAGLLRFAYLERRDFRG
jgi:uncharacterized membrane protein